VTKEDFLLQLGEYVVRNADLEQKLTEAKAAHAADRELLIKALEALEQVKNWQIRRHSGPEPWWVESVWSVVFSPEATKVMKERQQK
jgi:hypothetical protein